MNIEHDLFKRGLFLTALVVAAFACDRGSNPIPISGYVCEPADSSTAEVSVPVLRMTLPASWDENWFDSPAVFDLDADGKNEIIASRHSVLYVWKSAGELLWRAPVGENSTTQKDHGQSRQYAAPVIGDLDNNGQAEIAIAYSNKVAVYNHRGILLSGWPQEFPGPDGEIRSLAAADLNLDGSLEILAVKTSSGPVTAAWYLSGSLVPGWPQVQDCDQCYEYGGYNQNIGAANLDSDPLPEVVSTYDCSYIGIMYADGRPFSANAVFSGPYVSSVPMFHDIELAKQGWGPDGEDRDEFTDSPPAFGDIDGDGLLEIVLYSDHEKAGEYKNLGNCLWVLNPDLTRVAGFQQPICSGAPLYTGYENNIVQVAPAPALATLQGDDRPEIIVPSYDGYMRCFTPDGELLWDYEFDKPGGKFIGASGAVIGDLNGDGSPEVVFSTYSTAADVCHLVILDAGGNQLHKVAISSRGSMSPPTLADIDGNGSVQIIISLKDVIGNGLGGVQVWDVDSARDNCLIWHTGRGNYLRNGRLD